MDGLFSWEAEVPLAVTDPLPSLGLSVSICKMGVGLRALIYSGPDIL